MLYMSPLMSLYVAQETDDVTNDDDTL